jgi:glycine cleavage system regulatory protein
MRSQLVLTLIGRDRPGLVEALAAEVARHGGNWEQSRMAQLAGKFAGILRVSIEAERAQALAQALSKLEREGLKLVVEGSDATPDGPRGRHARLSLVGNDRPGIVHDLSRALAARGVNVEELETSCEAAPMGGGDLFRAQAVLQLPTALAVDDLRSALEALADDLMVELAPDRA